jgi:hypothetical protein
MEIWFYGVARVIPLPACKRSKWLLPLLLFLAAPKTFSAAAPARGQFFCLCLRTGIFPCNVGHDFPSLRGARETFLTTRVQGSADTSRKKFNSSQPGNLNSHIRRHGHPKKMVSRVPKTPAYFFAQAPRGLLFKGLLIANRSPADRRTLIYVLRAAAGSKWSFRSSSGHIFNC